MSWTYDPQLLGPGDDALTMLMRIRLELSDTDTTEQLLQDEEIFYLIVQESDFWARCARGAEIIARLFARQADKVENPTLKLSFKERVKHYAEMAQSLRKRSSGSHAPLAGGMSASAKATALANPDRTGPYFRRGMHDRDASGDSSSSFATGTSPIFR